MEVSSTLEVIEFRRTGPEGAECIVRCLTGTVVVGDIAVSAEFSTGKDVPIELSISHILRYGKSCDLLDPPHNALLGLSGTIPDGIATMGKLILSRDCAT